MVVSSRELLILHARCLLNTLKHDRLRHDGIYWSLGGRSIFVCLHFQNCMQPNQLLLLELQFVEELGILHSKTSAVKAAEEELYGKKLQYADLVATYHQQASATAVCAASSREHDLTYSFLHM